MLDPMSVVNRKRDYVAACPWEPGQVGRGEVRPLGEVTVVVPGKLGSLTLPAPVLRIAGIMAVFGVFLSRAQSLAVFSHKGNWVTTSLDN